jgi:hypothetical protein
MSRTIFNQKRLAREIEEFKATCKRVEESTVVTTHETVTQQQTRIKGYFTGTFKGFESFCRDYFPRYCKHEFGWFHKRAFNRIAKGERPDVIIAEWPREHAKSVFFDLLIPMWLLAAKKLTGMILVGETDEKASKLIRDIQVQLVANQRFIADYGKQAVLGMWTEGRFVTSDGIGFNAFGIDQNPAGTREGQNRPNYAVVDDADSRRASKNQVIIRERIERIQGELMGALQDDWILVFANNRVCGDGLTAHFVGDVNPGDLPNPEYYHIKVFATEDPKTHRCLKIEAGGVPAWKERYTLADIQAKIKKMTHRPAMRNLYHEDLRDGLVFHEEHISYIKPLKITDYYKVVTYCDPSFGDSKTNDYKAIVLAGITRAGQIHVLDIWCRHGSVNGMVHAHYTMCAKWNLVPINYMESNFIQGQHFNEYKAVGEQLGWQLSVRGDSRAKANKALRIEAMSGHFERGNIHFSDDVRNTTDGRVLIGQLLAFPAGNDDGPDALEGCIYMLTLGFSTSDIRPRTGGYKRSTKYAQ